MTRCCSLGNQIQAFLRDYDRLQSLALILIYIQIGCALAGSLGALYNGVLLINLAIALFALVAIESSSQSLGRTYAVLLCCAIFLDMSWFLLFAKAIWNVSSNDYGAYVRFSLKLALSMQIVGVSVRFFSSLLWIQMYRLGVSNVGSAHSQADFDLKNSFLNPRSPAIAIQPSDSDNFVGGSIYDPIYYSSLFEIGEDKDSPYRVHDQAVKDDGSTSASSSSRLKLSIGRSFQAFDEENRLNKPLMYED